MKYKRWRDLREKTFSPEKRAELDERVRRELEQMSSGEAAKSQSLTIEPAPKTHGRK